MAGRLGRPTTFTAQAGQAIAAGVAAGLSWASACGRAGVRQGTGDGWLRRQPEFAVSVENARLVAKARNELRIQAGSARWQASAWWLERRYPEEYGRRLAFVGGGLIGGESGEDLLIMGFLWRKPTRPARRIPAVVTIPAAVSDDDHASNGGPPAPAA